MQFLKQWWSHSDRIEAKKLQKEEGKSGGASVFKNWMEIKFEGQNEVITKNTNYTNSTFLKGNELLSDPIFIRIISSSGFRRFESQLKK